MFLRNPTYPRLLYVYDVCHDVAGGGYRAEKIILLTHGFCGSTCAVFAMAMRNHPEVVTTVSVGGYPDDEEMQYMSFPGGQVLDCSIDVFLLTGKKTMA